MAFEFKNRRISKIAVVGSGQIGPDIALHFSKNFHNFNVPVVVVDVLQDAIDRGAAKLKNKVQKGVESGAFKPETAKAIIENTSFTLDYDRLKDADLIIEAATENRDLKRKIFSRLEAMCSREAIFGSNSSHMEPEEIFAELKFPSRSLVIHYFFPAERNMVVEIVPGKHTDPELTEFILAFYEAIGKAPICVKSRYGYAIDPIFEGIFQAACHCVEAGLGTTREVDAVASRALGLTVGPFTAHNLTGGNPITHHGLNEMHEKIMPWFKSPKLLDEAIASSTVWDVPARGEKVDVAPEKEKAIADQLLGVYFGLVCEVLDSGITNISDFEMALQLALDIKPPFEMMNDMGLDRALALVEKYARAHEGFKVAECLRNQAATGKPWRIPTVQRKDHEDVAVIKIRRPRVLNALSDAVFEELREHFENIRMDKKIKGAVLTAFGIKAFVSGADVHSLAKIDSPETGESMSLKSQSVLNLIENLGKPVVCAMNGLAFGGGNEIAMACTARICNKGMAVLAAQPEPNLGIIPGAGATQRLPRLVGIKKAAELLRTGRTISSREAVEIGLVMQEVEGDLVAHAIDLVRKIAAGRIHVRPIPRGPMKDVPEKLPDVDIGHLSRAIDAIMCRAILDGAKMTLEEGLKYEAKMFGQCARTKDMKIGIENFLKNGPKVKANFVHA